MDLPKLCTSSFDQPHYHLLASEVYKHDLRLAAESEQLWFAALRYVAEVAPTQPTLNQGETGDRYDGGKNPACLTQPLLA
jgi:hypothetical protein